MGAEQIASKATPWGAIATGAGAAINLGKAIIGGIQAAKGRKQLNSLLANRPQYNISQGYLDAFRNYQNMANSGLPGYGQQAGQIQQSAAKAITGLERGAMGSNQYMEGVLNAQDKEMEAFRNLGIASAQWRAQQQQNLAQAQNQMGQLQDTAWQTNQMEPWGIKANMAANQWGTGQQNFWSGLQGLGGDIMNFAGTKYYADALKALQPK